MSGRQFDFLAEVRAEIVAACKEGMAPEEAADQVVKQLLWTYSGERVYIPTASHSRRSEAQKLIRKGLAPAVIAERLGVSPSTVYRWYQSRPKSEGFGSSEWSL